MPTKKSTFSSFDVEPQGQVDLSAILDAPPKPVESCGTCPNLQPRLSAPYKIAIIGEAPGEAEVFHQVPFCAIPTPTNPKAGASGRLLNDKLSAVGIVRDACFVGNICQHRPPANDISVFPFDGTEIAEGLRQLAADLATFQPNVCVLLGKTALLAAKGTTAISDWRGSLFVGDREGPFFGRKCIAAYHPAACLRQYEWTPLLWFDLKKAMEEATHKELILPQRELLTNLSYDQLINELDRILIARPKLSCDIEGWYHSLTCISLADSPYRSILVPFQHLNGDSFWTLEQEVEIWKRFVRIMADPLIKKIWQNGLYDRFVLQYGFNVVVYGSEDDTMLKFWEMWCELEKGLAFQNSILNKEPFYKFERKTSNEQTFFQYCCKDSCTTYENSNRLDRLLGPAQKQHYRFNHALLNPLLYMELRGIRYDIQLAKERLVEVNQHIAVLQKQLDDISGFNQPLTVDIVKSRYCNPNGSPKKGCAGLVKALNKYFIRGVADTKEIREALESTSSLNIKSPQFKTYLYETLKLPPQYKEDPKTKEKVLTVDYEALLRLSKLSKHPAISTAVKIGLLRTRSQMLEINADQDGRIRAGYNIVGTETGRITCYTSPTGSGYNLQTLPDHNSIKSEGDPLRQGMRDLVIADLGSYIGQCDLSGADGWTVGAMLASLGDSTMLDDLKAGIKPASRTCYLFRHGNMSLSGKSRPDIKALLKEVKKEDWDYFFSKQGIWGTCYTMGPRKICVRAFIESEGSVDLEEKKGKAFQDSVKTAYRIKLWHDDAQRKIKVKPELIAPNGFKRRFFGRWNEILGEYLAHLPQVITTYATNTALYKLWNDRENRIALQLRVEPLHQVHDALIPQWRQEDTTWAVGKIKQWFDNPIIVAGQKITIPFEGAYGHNWALDDHSKVGSI